jgi:hypothetical protein
MINNEGDSSILQPGKVSVTFKVLSVENIVEAHKSRHLVDSLEL